MFESKVFESKVFEGVSGKVPVAIVTLIQEIFVQMLHAGCRWVCHSDLGEQEQELRKGHANARALNLLKVSRCEQGCFCYTTTRAVWLTRNPSTGLPPGSLHTSGTARTLVSSSHRVSIRPSSPWGTSGSGSLLISSAVRSITCIKFKNLSLGLHEGDLRRHGMAPRLPP